MSFYICIYAQTHTHSFPFLPPNRVVVDHIINSNNEEEEERLKSLALKFLFNVGEKNKRVNSGGGSSIQNATALRVKKCKQADDEILFILFFFGGL